MVKSAVQVLAGLIVCAAAIFFLVPNEDQLEQPRPPEPVNQPEEPVQPEPSPPVDLPDGPQPEPSQPPKTPTKPPPSESTSEPKQSQQPALPELPAFIPSLYSHNHGDRNDVHSGNQYRTLLSSFCDARDFSQALPAAKSDQGYATTIYNLGYPKYKDNPDFFNKQIDWLVDCARKTGRLRVIINYDFYASSDQKNLVCASSRRAPSHDSGCPDKPDGSPGYIAANVPDAMKAFELLFGESGPENLGYTFAGSGQRVVAGISLAEENVTWDYRRTVDDGEVKYVFGKQMRSDFLDALYTQLSQQYGQASHKYLQWYSPHKLLINYPGSDDNWPLIDADGWVFDQYPMKTVGDQGSAEHSDYYKFVEAMYKLDKPLYSIVWASPLRYPTTGGLGKVNFDWWDVDVYEDRDGGWKSFHGQIAVNQKFDVNTLYYLLTPDPSGAIKHDVFMTLAGLPYKCGLGLYEKFMQVTLPYANSNRLPLSFGPGKPEWIVSSPENCD